MWTNFTAFWTKGDKALVTLESVRSLFRVSKNSFPFSFVSFFVFVTPRETPVLSLFLFSKRMETDRVNTTTER